MLGNYQWAEYNTAFWSLVYEMRVSLIFPVLAFVTLTAPRWAAFAAIACCFVIENTFLNGPPDSHTIFALPAFTAGILLARDHERLIAWMSSLSRTVILAAGSAAYLCYVYGLYIRHLPKPLSYLTEPLILAGAVFLVLASLSLRMCRNFLHRPTLQWLGHISYSMYLVHGTILFSLVHLFFGKIPLLAILPAFLVLTLLVSRVFYSLIERPSMNLGRRMTNARQN